MPKNTHDIEMDDSSDSGSREGSPIQSPRSLKSGSNSPVGSQHSASPSVNRSGSQSPAGSQRSGSRSPAGSQRSGSRSPAVSHRSGSRSPTGSQRSGSRSPAGSQRSGSRSPAGSHRSGSRSPAGSHRSGSRSPAGSHRSGSRSPAGSHKSGSRSPTGSHRSGSHSPAVSHRSGSRSPAVSHRSGSRSPAGSHRSGSRSPAGSHRSGSHSPAGSHKSGSRSPAGSRRSGSRSPAGSRKSGSHSPTGSRKSGSLSPAGSRKSGSRSPVGSTKNTRDSASRDSDSNSQRNLLVDEGEESDANEKSPKRPRKDSLSDIDSTEGGNKDVGADDLFGDADDISDSDDDKATSPGNKRKIRDSDSDEDASQSKKRRDHVLSDDEDDVKRGSDLERESREGTPKTQEQQEEEEDEPVIQETKIEAEIPKINTDLGKQIHFIKLPNFLSVETRPFDRETYEDEVEDEETLDEEGRARLKLKVENTIRWQQNFDKEGNVIRESNSKLVKWSDGSLSLHLGSEIFDVYKQPLQGDHNHLFIRQGTGLQGQAVFKTKLSFRPHSTDSFTHRKILSSLADRSLKTAGVKVLSQVMKDPDAKRNELYKRDEERLKATMRRASKQKRMKERSGNKGLSQDYLEADAEDDDTSINAIKNKHKQKLKKKAEIFSDSDSEGSDFAPSTSKKKAGKRPAHLTDSEEEEEEAEESAASGEEEEKKQSDSEDASGSD